jgi:oxygen-independent coproporphyrinogen-3 oxidase
MELPYNTTISADILKGTGQFHEQVATWATRRRWMRQAFEALEAAGYTAGSAYTAVKDPAKSKFVYRDRLWQGADLVALGVASFGHINGVHVQNLDAWETYAAAVDRKELPLGRAYQPTTEERMIREFILQLKRGAVRPAYFQDKYNVDVLRRFPSQLAALRAEGFLTSATAEGVKLSREGLLRVDSLLPRFFLPEHVGVRYT